MDLATTSVFIDFDGTITTADTGVHLNVQLAIGDWKQAEVDYEAGLIGSRECMSRQWRLIEHDEAKVGKVAAEVPIDAGFVPLVDGLRAAGAEVTVVSDGYGFHARRVCAELGIPVVTNDVDFERWEVVFPYDVDRCPSGCHACGVCKPMPIAEASARGRTTVLVGDGISDRHAARVADVVFATAGLAEWCAQRGVPHTPFATLSDVRQELLP